MIELAGRTDGEIIRIRLRGYQLTSEFASFGEDFVKLCGDRGCVRVLFDWTALEGCDTKATMRSAYCNWREGSPLIERMAIVHEHRWNRQGALLAAVLRADGRYVRSWIPREMIKAVAWLGQI